MPTDKELTRRERRIFLKGVTLGYGELKLRLWSTGIFATGVPVPALSTIKKAAMKAERTRKKEEGR